MSKPAQRKGHYTFAIIIFFICLTIIGISIFPLLNFQLNPSRTSPSLSVHWYWSNASARVIEMEVTSPLEGLFNSVKGVKSISSASYQGSGRIDLSFKENINMDAARFEIASLVRQIYPKLPQGVSYPQLSISASGTKETPILSYTIAGSASPYFIQKYTEEEIVPQVSKVLGINEVSVYGATPFEWEIVFDINKIRPLGITADDIRNAVNNYFRKNFIGQGAFVHPVTNGENEISIVLQSEGTDSESIKWGNIPIKKNDNRIIFLTDIASIRHREQLPSSYFRINGLNTINMVVFPEKETNNIKLASEIKQKIQEIRMHLAPGFSIIQAYDSTEFLNKELNKIALRSSMALGILLLFVALISRKLKYIFLILTSIIVNLAIAGIFFYFLKIEIHLYSLAGLTISFGLIIDNSIVMIDHYRLHKNEKVFLAILASTLTTIGALSIIFLLDENQRLNLTEFALVICISLAVSMAVALVFIPAVIDSINLSGSKNKSYFRRKRKIVKFNRFYEYFILFVKKWRWAFIIILLISFGLPVHWLPNDIKAEKESFWTNLYNKSLGNQDFKEDVKPFLEKSLGGTLRLFTNYVFENASYHDPERTTLNVNAAMPEGCTVQQLNETIELMENFISQFEEVEMFQTSIYGARNGRITINFIPKEENGSFPYFLKSQLESKANQFGGADWSVYGVGRGFSNAIHEGYKSSRIKLTGYNYEQLYKYAELLRSNLLRNERIKEVDIMGDEGWRTKALYEYYVAFDPKKLALNHVSPEHFHSFLKDHAYKNQLSPVYLESKMQNINLVSSSYQEFNVWDLYNSPVMVGERQHKLFQFGEMEKRKSGNDIHKHNQQYQLIVAFDFIGPHQLENLVKERHVKEMKEILPLGYKVESTGFRGWNAKEKKQYILIFLIIGIIFFTCSILFESFLQPLAIIGIIPVSFIGVFLTFYLFDFNFDQGGFASFILLCGIVVNAGVFIINDYNNYLKEERKIADIKKYLKAFNQKIIPVILTLISSILGLIPFIVGNKEIFWFAFAVGSIGGLLFSLLAVFIYLPLFVKMGNNGRYTH